MTRATPTGKLSRKKLLLLNKGRRHRHTLKVAYRRTTKALVYAYRDRKENKRLFRMKSISQINRGFDLYQLKYSHSIYQLLQNNVLLNRRMLADLAEYEPNTFKSIALILKNVQNHEIS